MRNFQISIVSAVKICKQCLHDCLWRTFSPDFLPGVTHGPTGGLSPQMKIPGPATADHKKDVHLAITMEDDTTEMTTKETMDKICGRWARDMEKRQGDKETVWSKSCNRQRRLSGVENGLTMTVWPDLQAKLQTLCMILNITQWWWWKSSGCRKRQSSLFARCVKIIYRVVRQLCSILSTLWCFNSESGFRAFRLFSPHSNYFRWLWSKLAARSQPATVKESTIKTVNFYTL